MNHGFAFAEHIKTEKIKRRKYEDDPKSPLRSRGFLLPVLLIIAAILIVFKLFSLQVIHGEDYKKLSDSNRTRTVVIHAPRGVIFDRNGEPLVYNVPGFRQTEGKKTIHLTREEALSKIAKGDRSVEIDNLREYPYKDAASHVLGYLGQISEEELKLPDFANYPSNDWIGKSGIERQYEKTLRGIDGKQLVEVDALGKIIRQLGQTDPISGIDITLNIDAKVQKAAYDATKDVKKGAIVVSKPNGEILAISSRPSFDPNLFTLDETYRASASSYPTVEGIIGDSENQPLLDRAIGGVYPPGSTFKLITAISGLENKLIDENFSITDTGILKIGEFSFSNWYYSQYGRTEGEVDVIKAIARSNDIFFYKLGQMVGVDNLSKSSKKFGLGEKLGIDLGGEVSGLVPTEEWKKKTLNEDWYLGDSYHYGIGQGYLLTTPLQVNAWTQVVANGGTLYQPQLLKSSKFKVKSSKLISEKNLSLIREGMIQSCSKGGVAWPLFDFKVQNAKLKVDNKNFLPVATGSADMRQVTVACKTGTAQHGGEKTLPHAWITLFAPAYNPEVVVTVLVESSGEGSNIAAPIAKKILEAYFKEKK